jgi:membrane associated rhomboid family serine protease
MPSVDEEFLLHLLRACAACAPDPLYPVRFARLQNLDRAKLDAGLDELRRRGLIHLTEWVKDAGQGYAPTEAGSKALATRRLPTQRAAVAEAPAAADRAHTVYERGEIVRAAIFEPATPHVSRALLAANLLFFFFGVYYAWNHDLDVSDYLGGIKLTTDVVLIRLGALDPSLVFPHGSRPQFERIILSSFLHIGLLHLSMNMYFLYSLGPLIESMWGSLRFLVIYLVSGVVSGCVVLQYSMSAERGAITAGASGCLFGIFVALVVWFWLNRGYLPERLIENWKNNLATNVILLIAINFLPNISWQGHLGGAIGGLLTALLLHVQRFHPAPAIRNLALVGVPIIPLGFFAAMLWQAWQTGWI